MNDQTEGAPGPDSADPAGRPAQAQPKLRFKTEGLKSSYCNVCNATSTREEVVLNFGVNQNWDQHPSEVTVDLLHRVILSPYAAKRLSDMLAKLIREHEARHGELR